MVAGWEGTRSGSRLAARLFALTLPPFLRVCPVCHRLPTLFERDLAKLSREVDAYQYKPARWRTAPGIRNSAGNLCLYLLGNLNPAIGAGLAHPGYVRNRDGEFAAPYLPQA